MSPAPDMMDEGIILNPPPNTMVLNVISSSDELDQNQYNEQHMDLGLVFFIIQFLFFSIR